MKKILLAFVAMLTFGFAQAQLPAGNQAPNWTATDLNGNTHTLQDYLDQGYHVIIDVSATWCGPCWNYHQSGVLEDIYNQHGPNGDQTIMVFWIEGDATTNLNCISNATGCNSTTQGDWTAGTPFPMFDNATIANDYQITYFPTTFAICPSGMIIDSETVQPSVAQFNSWFSEPLCQVATQSNDPAMAAYTGASQACGDLPLTVSLLNLGTSTLTACTITATGAGAPIVYNWSGSLATYASQEVTIGTINVSGTTNLSISVTSADDNATNNTVTAQVIPAVESSTHVVLDLLTDNWPGEVTWDITDDNGATVASGGPYAANGNMTTPVTVYQDIFLPSTGCYSFNLYDGYGDGLHGALYTGGSDGHCYVYGIESNGNYMPTFFDYNPAVTEEVYDTKSSVATVNLSVGVNEEAVAQIFGLYPNPTSGNTTLKYTLNKESVVKYDVVNMLGAKVMSQNIGTQQVGNYTTQIDFSNLSAGMYMVNFSANGAVSTMLLNVVK